MANEIEQEHETPPEEEVPPQDATLETDDDVPPAEDLEDGSETPPEDETPPEAGDKSGRFARVTRERKELAEKLRLTEERNRLLELQMQQGQRPAPKDDENLSEDEKWRRSANQEIARTQFQTFDAIDRNTYEMKSLSNPVYARWQERVEAELKKARVNGHNPPRENILKYLLGEAALGKIKAPAARGKTPARAAAERVTQPGGRSTVSPGKKAPSLREKLMGVKL